MIANFEKPSFWKLLKQSWFPDFGTSLIALCMLAVLAIAPSAMYLDLSLYELYATMPRHMAIIAAARCALVFAVVIAVTNALIIDLSRVHERYRRHCREYRRFLDEKPDTAQQMKAKPKRDFFEYAIPIGLGVIGIETLAIFGFVLHLVFTK